MQYIVQNIENCNNNQTYDNNTNLDLLWYTQNKIPGFSFMIRAKNEQHNILNAIQSIQNNLDNSIPYQIVVIDNNSNDLTLQIAIENIKQKNDCVIQYPYNIAKPGIENYYTPVDSRHSFVYFTQWCMMKCQCQWIFRWDADFIMDSQLAKWIKIFWDDHVLKTKYNCTTFDFVLIHAKDNDNIVNSEMYLFNANSLPFFYRRHIWEQTEFFKKHNFHHIVPMQIACIIHHSTLKNIKNNYLTKPWWTQFLDNATTCSDNYKNIIKHIDINYNKFLNNIPKDAQTFSRSMDPKPIEIVQQLKFNIQLPTLCQQLKDLIPYIVFDQTIIDKVNNNNTQNKEIGDPIYNQTNNDSLKSNSNRLTCNDKP